MEGTTSNCNNYHIVVSGDQCGTMAAEYGISLADFYTWNPGVGDDCSTLKVDYYVCVGVKVPTPSSTTTTTAAATTAMSSAGSVPSPTQSGLTSSCKKYHEVINGDGCYDLATAYGIALSEFYSWNPAVGDDCSVLQSGYYVCVGI
jgi:LysM repeat protein